VSFEEGVLRIRLNAPPVEGKANRELLRFLGRDVLGVRPSALHILRGDKARTKLIDITTLDPDSLLERIYAFLAG